MSRHRSAGRAIALTGSSRIAGSSATRFSDPSGRRSALFLVAETVGPTLMASWCPRHRYAAAAVQSGPQYPARARQRRLGSWCGTRRIEEQSVAHGRSGIRVASAPARRSALSSRSIPLVQRLGSDDRVQVIRHFRMPLLQVCGTENKASGRQLCQMRARGRRRGCHSRRFLEEQAFLVSVVQASVHRLHDAEVGPARPVHGGR